MNKPVYIPVYLLGIFLVTSYLVGYTPALFPVIFISASLLAFAAYAKDKHAARQGQWRVSENMLHIFSLCCGWPGAIIAQQVFRHKTRKTSFQIGFWLTLLANVGAVVWLHTDEGYASLHLYLDKLESFIAIQVGPGKLRSLLLSLIQY